MYEHPHPREGTRTHFLDWMDLMAFMGMNTLTPARGREPVSSAPRLLCYPSRMNTLTPARGRELVSCMLLLISLPPYEHPHPREGTRTDSFRCK